MKVQDLRFSYGNAGEVIKGITFSLAQGERVALLGPNGAGKSTLLLILTGLLKAQGTVDTGEGRPGLLFQDPDDQLFCTTLADDVAYGPRQMGLGESDVRMRVDRALAAVDLADLGSRHPHQLSGGQKKRGALASVLSMEPGSLALDEPTAALDPRARRALLRLLETLSQTMLVSTHDLDFARKLLPRSIVLDEGRIVFDGPTAELLEDEKFLLDHGLA